MTAPADFQAAFDVVLRHEGGFVDNPHDRGGATRWGVTEAVARASGYTGPMDKLPLSLAQEIYRKKYWNPLSLGKLKAAHQPVATYLMDMSINHGPKRATVLAQRAMNTLDYAVEVDGRWGPKTTAAAQFLCDKYLYSFLGALKVERGIFYKAIIAHDPSQKVFVRGWFRRCS